MSKESKESKSLKVSTGRGGHRPNAGRKPGTLSKRTLALQASVAASGETPLDFLLRIMRDPKKPWGMRVDVAKAAAPYVHAKLASIEVAGTGRDGALLVQLVGSDAAL